MTDRHPTHHSADPRNRRRPHRRRPPRRHHRRAHDPPAGPAPGTHAPPPHDQPAARDAWMVWLRSMLDAARAAAERCSSAQEARLRRGGRLIVLGRLIGALLDEEPALKPADLVRLAALLDGRRRTSSRTTTRATRRAKQTGDDTRDPLADILPATFGRLVEQIYGVRLTEDAPAPAPRRQSRPRRALTSRASASRAPTPAPPAPDADPRGQSNSPAEASPRATPPETTPPPTGRQRDGHAPPPQRRSAS